MTPDRRARALPAPWVLALAAALAAAACSPPEEILPGPRYDLRQTAAAAADLAEAADADGAEAAASAEPPPQPPNRVPLVEYSVRGEPAGLSLPAPRANAAWTHVAGAPAHAMPHLALGAPLDRIWITGIGEPETRRVRMTADPVVADGRIVTMSAFSEVQATATSGATLWRRDLTPETERPGQASGGGLAYADGRVYVTTGYGRLHVLDAATGATAWLQKLDAVPNSAPTVAGGFVYLTTRDARAWALDRDTGRILWQIEAGEPGPVVIDGAAPAVGPDAAIFPFGSGEVVAALRRSGVRRWSSAVSGGRLGRAYAEIGDITADPVVDGGRVYVGTPTGRLAALDRVTGERLWTAETGALSAVWPAGGAVFLLSDQNELVRLDAADGAEVWAATLPLWTRERIRRRRGVFAHYGPVLAGGRLIVASSDGVLREADPASGRLLRETPLGAPAAADPVVAQGTLYVVTADGRLHALR